MDIVPKAFGFVKRYGFDLLVLFSVTFIALISYNLGRIHALEKTPLKVTQEAILFNAAPQKDNSTTTKTAPARTDGRVVVSKNSSSKRYHFSWCSGAKQIKQENQIWFPSAASAQAAGYTLAGNCQ